jgi:ERF superfamily protein
MTEVAIPIDQIDPVPERKPRKRANGKALAVQSEAPAPAPVSEGGPMLALFERMARDPTIDPARIQEFLRMKREEEDRQAQRAFNAAMAQAKAEFEPIVKRHLVGYDNKGGGKTSYKHEDLADIEAAVKPSLSSHGLSYRFRGASEPNEPVSVTCIVTHDGGHFEETTLRAGADNSGGKNSIQGIGSTITYLQRYTLKLALGLAAGRDDDGRAAGEQPSMFITDAQCSTILDKIAMTESDVARFCKYMGVDGVEKIPANKFQRAIDALNAKGRK